MSKQAMDEKDILKGQALVLTTLQGFSDLEKIAILRATADLVNQMLQTKAMGIHINKLLGGG